MSQETSTATPVTVVLVHGAFADASSWTGVIQRLQARGVQVTAPANPLRGISHDSAYLASVLDQIPGPVIAVAHSYGGWPSSGALETIHDRVASIVWLDAFKPEDGQKGTDFASEFSRKALVEALAKGEPGRKGPPAKTFSVSEKDYAWLDSKLTPQPNGVATQPIKLTGKRETVARKTYIRAAKYPQAAFDKALADCKADKTWQTFVNETSGHDVMIDQPEWLADILLKMS